jgi:hypothetical protein
MISIFAVLYSRDNDWLLIFIIVAISDRELVDETS